MTAILSELRHVHVENDSAAGRCVLRTRKFRSNCHFRIIRIKYLKNIKMSTQAQILSTQRYCYTNALLNSVW